MKALHKRQMEADREAFERAKEKTAREELERTRAVAGVNHLEIPAELAYILGKLDGNYSILILIVLVLILLLFYYFE